MEKLKQGLNLGQAPRLRRGEVVFALYSCDSPNITKDKEYQLLSDPIQTKTHGRLVNVEFRLTTDGGNESDVAYMHFRGNQE